VIHKLTIVRHKVTFVRYILAIAKKMLPTKVLPTNFQQKMLKVVFF